MKDFFYRSTLEKKYNGIINCRAKGWKRLELAEGLNNLSLIINRDNISNQFGADSETWKKLKYSYLNNKKLARHEVAYISNLSRVGLILSDKEGACYSSSEFLLCGLPVISTQPSTDSLGGREFWYNDYNSILVPPDQEAVRDAYEELIRRDTDPRKIRQEHVSLMARQRHEFVHIVLEKIFSHIKSDGGSTPNESYYFEENFYMKGGTVWHALQAELHVKSFDEIAKILCI